MRDIAYNEATYPHQTSNAIMIKTFVICGEWLAVDKPV